MGAQMLRQRTGQGQYMDISLVEAGLAWTVWESGAFFGGGEVPQATGTRHRRSTPYQAYRTADGYVTIGAGNDRLWKRLVEDALGRPEWMEDPRFLTLPDRMRHIDELEAEIEAITTQKTTDEWIEIVDKAGVPCGPVLSYDQTWQDPQVLARGMVAEIEHPIIGSMRTVAPPTKFSDMEFAVRRPAPWLGQHSAEVLRESGITEDRIAELFEAGVLYDAHPDRERDHAHTPSTAETRS
jgi:crotonobetainyl-CoA:carnitine CoA-transferase CaiB-like acyl-CoA transferase